MVVHVLSGFNDHLFNVAILIEFYFVIKIIKYKIQKHFCNQ